MASETDPFQEIAEALEKVYDDLEKAAPVAEFTKGKVKLELWQARALAPMRDSHYVLDPDLGDVQWRTIHGGVYCSQPL